MIHTILSCLLLSFATALLFASSPIILGFICLAMAFLAAALLMSLFSSWFGLIALLIYVGGLLVMFAYFLAICPNQLISMKMPLTMFSLMTLLTLLLSSPHTDTPTNSQPTLLSNMFLPPHASLLILLALLLLLTMIIVVKVTQRRRGPLRPFN